MKSITKTMGYLVIGLTALAASAFADRLYVPAVRELPELRSATSRHFLLADGTYSAECTLEPMNYKATDGTWQPIDTNLNPTTKDAFALANEANTLKTYLPNTGGGWVRVEAGQGAVSFRPLGVADGTSSVKGNRLDIADVGRNITLSYEALPGRLKETLTISAPISAPSFSYALRLEGLVAHT